MDYRNMETAIIHCSLANNSAFIQEYIVHSRGRLKRGLLHFNIVWDVYHFCFALQDIKYNIK